MSTLTDALSGRTVTEVDDNGIGPQGSYVRYRDVSGNILAGVANDGTVWCKGINGNVQYYKTITIPSAQILTLHSVPITLIAAPAMGYVNVLQEFIMQYKYGTAPYVTGSQNLGTFYDSQQAFPISLTGAIGFLNLSANEIANPVIQSNFVVAQSNCEGQPIYLYLTTSDPTGGDGVIYATVKWFQIQLY